MIELEITKMSLGKAIDWFRAEMGLLGIPCNVIAGRGDGEGMTFSYVAGADEGDYEVVEFAEGATLAVVVEGAKGENK